MSDIIIKSSANARKVFEEYFSSDNELISAFNDLDSLSDIFVHNSGRDSTGLANALFTINSVKKVLLAMKLDGKGN